MWSLWKTVQYNWSLSDKRKKNKEEYFYREWNLDESDKDHFTDFQVILVERFVMLYHIFSLC